MEQAQAVLARLRADLGGNRLEQRVAMEVLRLRGEGQFDLADQLAAIKLDEVETGK